MLLFGVAQRVSGDKVSVGLAQSLLNRRPSCCFTFLKTSVSDSVLPIVSLTSVTVLSINGEDFRDAQK